MHSRHKALFQCHLDFCCFSTTPGWVLCHLLSHPYPVTCIILLPWQSLDVGKERAKASAQLQGGALDTSEDLSCPAINPAQRSLCPVTRHAQGNMLLISK